MSFSFDPNLFVRVITAPNSAFAQIRDNEEKYFASSVAVFLVASVIGLLMLMPFVMMPLDDAYYERFEENDIDVDIPTGGVDIVLFVGISIISGIISNVLFYFIGKKLGGNTNWKKVFSVMFYAYVPAIPMVVVISGLMFLMWGSLVAIDPSYLMASDADDQYSVGVYADEVDVSDSHFRIIMHAPTAIMFNDDTTTEAFGIVQGTYGTIIHDVRYHVAEKMTGLYLRSDTPEDFTQLYVDALDFCDDFEAANKNPDKYLSHRIAGIASMEHKKGLSDRNLLQQSKITCEKVLVMSPDRHFYLTGYALLLDQIGYDATVTLPLVKKALEIDPDHGYAITVRDRILS